MIINYNQYSFQRDIDIYPETEQHHAGRVPATGLENLDGLRSVLEAHSPEYERIRDAASRSNSAVLPVETDVGETLLRDESLDDGEKRREL